MIGLELKPCPFCAGIAKVCEGPNHGWWGTICDDCGVWRDDRHGTQAEAIAAWNTRTPDPAQIRADALRAALAECCGDSPSDCRDAILALIDAPLSPPAVDNSPAPDAGGKGACDGNS